MKNLTKGTFPSSGKERREPVALTLVQGINDDEGLNLCPLERVNGEFLHLSTKGLAVKLEATLLGSAVPVSKPEDQGRKICAKIGPVIVIS